MRCSPSGSRSPQLLRDPTAASTQVRATIRVPDVQATAPKKRACASSRRRSCVAACPGRLRALSDILGSPLDDLPLATQEHTAADNPSSLDPALLHDKNPNHTKVTMAAGPNNPVGVAWLGLSKKHYGIHGTPNPAKVGHRETNGCVHLTNWDATRLVSIAPVGTPVEVWQ